MMTGPSSVQRALSSTGASKGFFSPSTWQGAALNQVGMLTKTPQTGHGLHGGSSCRLPNPHAVSSGQALRPGSALAAGRGWGLGGLVSSLRAPVSRALQSQASQFRASQSRAVSSQLVAGAAGQTVRSQLSAVGAVLSQVVRPEPAVLFVTAAGALLGALAWANTRRSDGDQPGDGRISEGKPPSDSSNSALERTPTAAELAGEWVIRQHREYSAFTPPAINNHVCSTRYSTANISVSGNEARLTERLQLVEQGSKGLIQSRLDGPMEAQSYPKSQEMTLRFSEEDGFARVVSSPIEETIGFEKSPDARGPAEFPDVGDRSQEKLDPVSQKPLGYLASAEVKFMMVHVKGRVRTMQILRGNLEGEVKGDDTMRGDLNLDFQQAVSFSDNKRIRNASPKDRFVSENSDWVALRRPASWGANWPEGRSREEALEDLHKLFEDQPLKSGAEEIGQKGWGLDLNN